MHLQSLLWMGLVAFTATVFFRRLAAPGELRIAGLAALLFAVDDAHALPVYWLANRSALLAVFFGLLALIAHHEWRSKASRGGALLAPAFLLLALLSAEGAVACGAYLLGYALFLEHGPLRHRLLGLLPATVVGAGWLLVYRASGYGVRDSTVYIDPGGEPLRFLGAVVERGPLLLWSQLGFPPADALALLSQPTARLAWFVVVALLGLFALFTIPLLRRDAMARFCAFGTLLAVLPSCATFAAQRLLFFAGLGGAGLVAIILARGWSRAAELPLWWRRSAKILTPPLILVHLVLAPLGLVATGDTLSTFGEVFAHAASTLPGDPAVRGQQAVIVNAPSFFVAGYAPIYQAARGRPIPAGILTLTTGLYEVEVRRLDERTLSARPHGGLLAPPGSAPPGRQAARFSTAYIFQAFDMLLRGTEPFEAGQQIDYRQIQIEVDRVEDGRVAEVRFRFETDLEDPRWRWLRWEPVERGFVPWRPPSIGESATLPPVIP